MNILYTIDNNFFPQLLVSITSLLRFKKSSIHIYIICEDLTSQNKAILNNLKNIYHVDIVFLHAPHVHDNLSADRGSISQFYRLYLTEIFKEIDISRVIFLDADTLVVSDKLVDLFNTDLKGNIIGACLDPWSKHYRKLFDLETYSNMFNAGILLIDLQAWRYSKIDSKIAELVKDSGKNRYQADQGILNQIFAGEFCVINPKYNMISSYFEFSYSQLLVYRKPICFYDKNNINDAVKNPCVIHFTSTFLHSRPWEDNNSVIVHPYKDKWIEIACQNTLNFKIIKQNNFLQKLYTIFPKSIAIYVLGFLQADVRPNLQFLQSFVKK